MNRKILDPDLAQLRHDLPAIAKISQVFGASPSLVRRWYNGQRGVSPRYREKIKNYNRTGALCPISDTNENRVRGYEKVSDIESFWIDSDRATMIRRDGSVMRRPVKK